MFFFCLLGFSVISSLILLLKFIITRDHQPFHSKSDLISPIMPVPKYPQSIPSPMFLTEQRHKSSPTRPHHPGSGHICVTCHRPIRYFTSRPGAVPRAAPQPPSRTHEDLLLGPPHSSEPPDRTVHAVMTRRTPRAGHVSPETGK